jgi:hypothetical protein
MISVEYSDDESEYVDTSGAVDPFDFINCDSDEGAQDVEEEEEAAPAIALTPKGTPSYADAVRSRPTSECVPNEPEPEDPVVEDIEVETVEVRSYSSLLSIVLILIILGARPGYSSFPG